jgi:hypothetical protein
VVNALLLLWQTSCVLRALELKNSEFVFQFFPSGGSQTGTMVVLALTAI